MKYSELIHSWRESKAQWNNYQYNASIVAARVYSILRTRFDLKDEKLFKLIDPDETSTDKIQKTVYSPVGATKLTDNGWAKFGLYLVLEFADNTWPKDQYKIISFIKILEDKVLFKVNEESGPTKLKLEFNEDDEDLIEKAYDELLNRLIKNSFQNWLNS